jgi:hypothetical protein
MRTAFATAGPRRELCCADGRRGTRTSFHSETGKGAQPKVAHFQYRPDPLAH